MRSVDRCGRLLAAPAGIVTAGGSRGRKGRRPDGFLGRPQAQRRGGKPLQPKATSRDCPLSWAAKRQGVREGYSGSLCVRCDSIGSLAPIEKQREWCAELGALCGYADLGAGCFASGQACGLAVEKSRIQHAELGAPVARRVRGGLSHLESGFALTL